MSEAIENSKTFAGALERMVGLLDELQQKREEISDYGYRTGRTNDRIIESMEDDFIRIGVRLCDTWRDSKH